MDVVVVADWEVNCDAVFEVSVNKHDKVMVPHLEQPSCCGHGAVKKEVYRSLTFDIAFRNHKVAIILETHHIFIL